MPYTNQMIPDLIDLPGSPWPVLPVGAHRATLVEVNSHFAYNHRRRQLFAGLMIASRSLAQAGCMRLFLDGSFVTKKPEPRDYDVCWDPDGVDRHQLDPVFTDFDNNRAAQKAKFGGEFFPSTASVGSNGRKFIDFFQADKFTSQPKGIVLIVLTDDPALKSETMP